MTTDNTYNGWTNYETWLVKLWIDNDEGSQDYWTRQSRRLDAYKLAQSLQEEHEEAATNLAGVTGVYADLMTASLGRVNWDEIARSLMDDIGELDDLDDEEEEDDYEDDEDEAD